jgi:mono/diheme cytochrome c family protein
MYGTSMPAWQSLLSDADVRDVVDYVKAFSPRFSAERPQPVLDPEVAAANGRSGRRTSGVPRKRGVRL